MHERNKKSIVVIALLLVSVGLSGCAKNNKSASASADTSVSAAACAGNVYLEKYHCSLEEVQQAALAGNPDAQYALGYMYYYGIGTVHDQQTAALWIQRAASQGEPLAEQAQQMIAAEQNSSTSHNTVTTHAAVTHPQPWMNSQSTAAVQPVATTTSSQTVSVNDPRLLPGSTPKVASTSSANTAKIAMNGSTTNTSTGLVNLLNKNPHHYTLQLMGSYDKRAIEQFIRTQGIQQQVTIYQAAFHGKSWYILIYGDYDSATIARGAVHALPNQLRQLNPWVKSYGLVQEEIREHRVI
jgi:DamX protein